jgi:hypothetical protein
LGLSSIGINLVEISIINLLKYNVKPIGTKITIPVTK